jgi:hypothetical protein
LQLGFLRIRRRLQAFRETWFFSRHVFNPLFHAGNDESRIALQIVSDGLGLPPASTRTSIVEIGRIRRPAALSSGATGRQRSLADREKGGKRRIAVTSAAGIGQKPAWTPGALLDIASPLPQSARPVRRRSRSWGSKDIG